jgi:hypothetical protein
VSIERIPERVLVTCDVCRAKCDMSIKFSRRREGRLIIDAHGLDHLGSVAGPGKREFDLCDSCLRRIETAVDETITAINSAS